MSKLKLEYLAVTSFNQLLALLLFKRFNFFRFYMLKINMSLVRFGYHSIDSGEHLARTSLAIFRYLMSFSINLLVLAISRDLATRRSSFSAILYLPSTAVS